MAVLRGIMHDVADQQLVHTNSSLTTHSLSGSLSEFGPEKILEIKTCQANAAAAAFTPQMGSKASLRAGATVAGEETGASAFPVDCG